MKMMAGKDTMALCVACGEKIDVGPSPKKGQFIDCPVCDTMLEVVSVAPVKLDWIEDEMEYEEEADEDNYEFDDEENDYGSYDDD